MPSTTWMNLIIRLFPTFRRPPSPSQGSAAWMDSALRTVRLDAVRSEPAAEMKGRCHDLGGLLALEVPEIQPQHLRRDIYQFVAH